MSVASSPLLIALVGPESSGKSTFCQAMAARLQQAGIDAAVVDEYAREYYASREYRPTLDDVLAIAAGQQAAEARLAAQHRVLLCDTTLLTCRLWAEIGFGVSPAVLSAADHASRYRLTWLMQPDMPWQADPLRSHPQAREMLFARHQALLAELAVDYQVLSGSVIQRLAAAWPALQTCLPELPAF